MPLQIVTVPCLTDNYAFLAHDPDSGQTAAVDVPDAAPLAAELEARGWQLSHILLTHHHGDHIDGVAALKNGRAVTVVGAKVDAHRLPPLDVEVAEGDSFTLGDTEVQVIDVSGHTVGHIAFHIPTAQAVFTADSLMALGCGRVFEGTPEMMWASLSKLAALPEGTVVYSGHEYTETNARFALTIEPENAELRARSAEIVRSRAMGQPTVPSRLDEELATNPFLRAGQPEVKALVGLPDAPDAEVFAEICGRKDRF